MLPSLEEIAKKRRILNLTQKQLAQSAGVSQSLIAKTRFLYKLIVKSKYVTRTYKHIFRKGKGALRQSEKAKTGLFKANP